ncbi:5'-3' exoribonuclease [Halomicronema hongdechloris C2206]|uniref:5'-3' exoribonuclease n=1 Tax=Halomicronema hongdechloris C2206 TaxID=1641165 RepID=A0A1Z3HH39_9CYAN|nr:5'-3' exoribonuclease [Halomicronema hongdechloris C2206]
MAVSLTQLSASAQIGHHADTLRSIFKQVDDTSCPKGYNFHMHTVCSDGRLTPADLMAQALSLGLKEFAITDHHNVKGFYQAKQWLEDWQWHHPARISSSCRYSSGLPRLWVGAEITALLARIDVHILGYAFDPSHKAMYPYLQGHAPRGSHRESKRVIQAIQQAGGIAVLAHPARYRRPASELIQVAVGEGIDGVEAYYAYDNPSQWRPCPKQTPEIEALATEYQLLTTCGTDTHGLNLTRRL